MIAPRLEIDLDKIHHNARTLVERLALRGITVTGITKATLGTPEIAEVLIRAGVSGLGDSRIENIEAMRRSFAQATMTLIRSPMLSQADRVVAHADVSCNTELDVIARLSYEAEAAKRIHGVMLMVELGDLREGIMPADIHDAVRETLRFHNIALKGIGTNLACQSGVTPDANNMAELSALADSVESTFGITLEIVSGGNSGNLCWALGGSDTGRIDNLRLGEAVLLGCEPLHRRPIDGLHTDAFTLVAEVIESKVKPSEPWGEIAQTAFGAKPAVADSGLRARTILALGRQDVDTCGLRSSSGIEVLGTSGDHLVMDAGTRLAIGSEIAFQPNYSALVQAMTSPFVTKVYSHQMRRDENARTPQAPRKCGSGKYLSG
ncbi:MAG: putative amino acid racemase [Myxococcota bacterium]|jgi:predicted amino acid racemase